MCAHPRTGDGTSKGLIARMGIRRLLATTLAGLAVAAASASAAPMIMLFGTPDTNRQIVRPGHSTALPLDGRLFVAEPNPGHLFAGDADKPFRLDHVDATDLIAKGSGDAMASYLKHRLDADSCNFAKWGKVDCRSGLLTIDELDYRFSERAPNLNTPAWKRADRKYPNYVPRVREGQPGLEFSQAMEILAATPWPGGGTYADRVHVFIAPGMLSSLGVAGGVYHNLGRDKKPHFQTYEGVRRGVQLSGGVWIEMYHFDRGGRGRYPFNTKEWQVYPWRFSQWLTRPGLAPTPDPALVAKMHFMMSSGMPRKVGTAPAACSNPRTPQACQFALASTKKNAPVLANGVGAYRMDKGHAPEFRLHLRRLFY